MTASDLVGRLREHMGTFGWNRSSDETDKLLAEAIDEIERLSALSRLQGLDREEVSEVIYDACEAWNNMDVWSRPVLQQHLADAVLNKYSERLPGPSSTADAACEAKASTLVPGWQPIETAPKDGTSVLLAEQIQGHGFVQTVGRWHAEFDSEYNADNDEIYYRGAWTDGTVADWGMQEYAELQPTHWQPLPAPPPSLAPEQVKP